MQVRGGWIPPNVFCRGLTINSLALKSTCFEMFGHPLPILSINRNHLQFAHTDIYIAKIIIRICECGLRF